MLKRKFIIIITIILAFCSCSDWLDLEPVDGVVKQEFWRNKEDVHSSVIGVYSSLLNNDLMTRIIYWGDLRADMVTASTNASSKVKNVIKGEMSTDNDIVKWDAFYKTINQCNDVLSNAPGVREVDNSFTESALAQYEAEVKTVRALMYFYLVRSFSDVPFILEASESDLQDYNVSKSEGTTILEALVEDLEDILQAEYLPITYGDNDSDKGRVTRWTAMALLADIYLWQEEYAKCNNLCTQIIGSGKFSLIPVSRERVEIALEGGLTDSVYHVSESDVNSLFDKLYVTGNSIESIFEFQFPKTSEVLDDPFYTLFSSSTNQQLISNDDIVSTVIFPEYTGTDRDVYDIRTNTFSYRNGYVWKWTGLSRAENTVRPYRTFPHWIVYRYPDVLLMKAEALTQLAINEGNDQVRLKEAYDLVKQVRDRANAIEDSESMIDTNEIAGKSLERLILSERARELAFEGKRWYDVLRHAKRNNFSEENYIYLQDVAINSAPSDKVASLLTKYKSKWFCYWPILNSAIETNPLLEQNEYYKE